MTLTLEQLLVLTLISNIVLFLTVVIVKITDMVSLNNENKVLVISKLENEQRSIYTNRIIADKLADSNSWNQDKLEEIHNTVKEVGEKADASYQEANHANLKIQAVLDVVETEQGKEKVVVTARGLRENVGKDGNIKDKVEEDKKE